MKVPRGCSISRCVHGNVRQSHSDRRWSEVRYAWTYIDPGSEESFPDAVHSRLGAAELEESWARFGLRSGRADVPSMDRNLRRAERDVWTVQTDLRIVDTLSTGDIRGLSRAFGHRSESPGRNSRLPRSAPACARGRRKRVDGCRKAARGAIEPPRNRRDACGGPGRSTRIGREVTCGRPGLPGGPFGRGVSRSKGENASWGQERAGRPPFDHGKSFSPRSSGWGEATRTRPGRDHEFRGPCGHGTRSDVGFRRLGEERLVMVVWEPRSVPCSRRLPPAWYPWACVEDSRQTDSAPGGDAWLDVCKNEAEAYRWPSSGQLLTV